MNFFSVVGPWAGSCLNANDKLPNNERTQIRVDITSKEQCLRECKLKENVSGCHYQVMQGYDYNIENYYSQKKCFFYTSPVKGYGQIISSVYTGSLCWKIEA